MKSFSRLLLILRYTIYVFYDNQNNYEHSSKKRIKERLFWSFIIWVCCSCRVCQSASKEGRHVCNPVLSLQSLRAITRAMVSSSRGGALGAPSITWRHHTLANNADKIVKRCCCVLGNENKFSL